MLDTFSQSIISLLQDASFKEPAIISDGTGLSISLLRSSHRRSSTPQDATDWRCLVEFRSENESEDFEAELLVCVRPDRQGEFHIWNPATHLRIERISDANRAREWAEA